MGYIFTYNDASVWHQRMDSPFIRERVRMENRLMYNLLNPLKGQSVLDIGCGCGNTMLALLEAGLDVSGLDASPYMLEFAEKNLGNRAELYRGMAEDLPFEDNSFSYVTMMYSLEYMDDADKVLAESCRVAKDKIFIGILNRHSVQSVRLRAARFFSRSIYSQARFFSVWEIRRMARSILGNIPFEWNSASLYTLPFARFFKKREYTAFISKNPAAPFIGMVIVPVPYYRTRPLELKCRTKPAAGTMAGLARSGRSQENGSISL